MSTSTLRRRNIRRWRFASQVSLDVYVGEDEFTLRAAAARLLAAISHKEGSYPSNVKAELVLVLDALAVPEANEPAVQELVRTAVTTTGFQSVWVCGALESQTWQVASAS